MRRTPKLLATTVVALCLVLGIVLQAGAHEGPTRSDELGDVHFAVSCTDAAQAKFHRAMALYHSFDWPRGKAAFDEIASLDPRCGMAHWGLAMVAADNPFGWPVSLKLTGRGRGDPEGAGRRGCHAARARLHRGARGALPGPCDGAAPSARPRL